MARRLFDQQAMALGRLFTIAANFTDPDAYFIGGGVIETAPEFRDWFLDRVRRLHRAARRAAARSPGSSSSPTSTWPAPAGAAIAALSAARAHDLTRRRVSPRAKRDDEPRTVV